uniref:unspecific monooxygenase n=1 Tax=Maruca vitrata TaxID=497515 RepID=A0AAU7N4W7_MARVT
MAALVFVAILAGLVSVFYYWMKKKFSFWSERGVRGPKPYPIVGNFGSVILGRESGQMYLKRIYLEYEDEKLVGLYRGFQPVLLVRDLELLKQVLVKDFHVFQDRGMSRSRSKLSKNLFATGGETWKILRKTLTPVFTSRKLKDMIPLVLKCVNNFTKYVDSLVENNVEHEIKSLTSKYTLDVIGSCAFGLELNTATDAKNDFSIMAEKIFTPNTANRLLNILDMIIPGIRSLIVTNTEIQDFFLKLTQTVIQERDGKPSTRKDFMDLMLQLREEGKATRKIEDGVSEIEFDDYMIAAQSLVFYSAGYETSAATMSFMIHEMALNPDIQERIHEEVCQVYKKHNGELTYESVKDMPYLGMVFDETLRKYAVAGLLFRVSSEPYTFAGTNVSIPKGTPILVSGNGITMDPKYYPNPEVFNPEHFSPENLKNLPQCAYLPFGEGPRNCIGLRFAKVESLLGMAAFLKHFKVEPSSKTKSKIDFHPKRIVMVAQDGIWVKISKR